VGFLVSETISSDVWGVTDNGKISQAVGYIEFGRFLRRSKKRNEILHTLSDNLPPLRILVIGVILLPFNPDMLRPESSFTSRRVVVGEYDCLYVSLGF
jgi:hypothetical protein